MYRVMSYKFSAPVTYPNLPSAMIAAKYEAYQSSPGGYGFSCIILPSGSLMVYRGENCELPDDLPETWQAAGFYTDEQGKLCFNQAYSFPL